MFNSTMKSKWGSSFRLYNCVVCCVESSQRCIVTGHVTMSHSHAVVRCLVVLPAATAKTTRRRRAFMTFHLSDRSEKSPSESSEARSDRVGSKMAIKRCRLAGRPADTKNIYLKICSLLIRAYWANVTDSLCSYECHLGQASKFVFYQMQNCIL